MQNQVKYIGRIVSVPGNRDFAFIGINSVEKEEGSPHSIVTSGDIFLHKDDFSGDLNVGTKVSFEVTPDQNRGEGYYRATYAMTFVDADLLPENEQPMPGFNALACFGQGAEVSSLAISPTPAQKSRMKKVNPVDVHKVLQNKPAETIPRDSSIPENISGFIREFLAFLFPALAQFGCHFNLDEEEDEFTKQLEQAEGDYETLGMQDQLTILKEEVKKFLVFRKALSFMRDQNLIRHDTIIPIHYLPDFFTAVPVWFFWAEKTSYGWMSVDSDPTVHPSTSYFCDLFPSQNWSNMFQIFNRRARNLASYKGDIIPPSVTRRMIEASQLFDYVVIMTPYHDVAGKDWSDTSWVRSIDPYVVGFKKGVPFFFILARFSDSGTFPLFTEMVADTVAFLREKHTGLSGFGNSNTNPFWHIAGSEVNSYHLLPIENKPASLGQYLIREVQEALNAFDAGQLFNWLRGEVVK